MLRTTHLAQIVILGVFMALHVDASAFSTEHGDHRLDGLFLNVSYTHMKVSWKPPAVNAKNVNHYIVEYFLFKHRLDQSSVLVGADETECLVKGLTPGTRYGFIVHANLTSGAQIQSYTVVHQTLGYGPDRPCDCDLWGTNTTIAPICHAKTGQCKCKTKHVVGDRCDTCEKRYVRHEKIGCDACNCPLDRSNGSCYIDGAGAQMCHCKGSYTGPLCTACVNGQRMMGGKCKECSCHGNEDLNAPQICNATGYCMACAHNTTGSRCQRCLPEYVGDAYYQNCTLPGDAHPRKDDDGQEDEGAHSSRHTMVAVVIVLVAVLLAFILVVVFLRCRRLRHKPFGFWTVELRSNREDVNFSSRMEQPEYQHIDNSLVSSPDEVQYFEKEKPVLSFTRNGGSRGAFMPLKS